MAKSNNKVSKAAVQSTELNKFAANGAQDTEFSAEEAAEVFEQNQAANRNANQNQQNQNNQ